MKIIGFVNSKGGVGKSTVACNIAVEVARNGGHPLLIDGDIQGSSLAFRATRELDDIKAVAITTPTIHKDIKDFTGFSMAIIDAGGRDTAVFRSAIMACDLLLIPTCPSQYDIWACNDCVTVLKEARTYKDIPAFFILNQLIPNTIISKEATEALNEFSGNVELLSTTLTSRVAFKNSISHGKGVSEYEPDGKASVEIKNLYKEIKELLNGN